MRPIGALYLHVPFCARKCAYCDFPSRATQEGDLRMADYANGLAAQLFELAARGLLNNVRTAYVGGGTPTMLGATALGSLVAGIRRSCSHIDELTCEANPDSLTNEVLEALVESGATRVSVGVQSLANKELRALGRLHTAAQAQERVRAAVATGLNVSVDLMCAIPYQTDETWQQTLRDVLALGVDHVSVYPLSLEEGTPFYARYASVPTPWNDEDVQASRMEQAAHMLGQAGLLRYEVASYARQGKECAHNIAYWTGVPYLGLGPGAASMLDRAGYERLRAVWAHLPPASEDASRLRFVLPGKDVECMSEREAWAEDLMLGMRLTRGVEADRVPPATRASLIGRGLVREEGECLVPTHDGWLLGNELFGELWDLAHGEEG